MYRNTSFFDAPHAATFVLLFLNFLAFGICLAGNSLVSIGLPTLYYGGALYDGAMPRHEYWRFIAYAFLHANTIHLLMNMICLVMWAGILEKRTGATYFVLIYLMSAIGGGVASVYGHSGAFLTVGASGSDFRRVGALLCLAILGKLPLPPQFFVITIGVNAVLMTAASKIDWVAHLGGFTAGMAACAALDAMATANKYWLRCRFPEFVKFGLIVAFVAACLLYLPDLTALEGRQDYARVAMLVLGAIVLTKGTDFLLTQTKGLAVAVIMITALYAMLPVLFAADVQHFAAQTCTMGGSNALIGNVTGIACRGAGVAPYLLAGLLCVGTLASLGRELRRGWHDVGFVASTLRAERNRRSGI